MVGKSISHYKIVSELGRGGMGIVYKAEDTRLNRTVAVKVLPPHGVVEEDSQSRFGREAQAAAALNHPNIATVFEIDEEEGRPFIVMEFVDGPSLKDRIEDAPLKLDEAIKLGIQVASGLEAAHEQRIVHRDIKPANVMLTTKGQAKIMDFGLAKLSDQTTLTKTGTTLGTAAYMSPEQARGEKVDHRSDIFALGTLIYEMLAGQMAFKGAYAEAVVYSILNVDPDPITSLRTGVPMELERIVNKALAKNPKERYQGMSDLLVDLRALENASPSSSSGTSKMVSMQSAETRSERTSVLPWIVSAAMFLIALLSFWRPWASASPELVVTKMPFQIPEGQVLSGWGSAVAISRDGTRIVYTATENRVRRLYLKEIDSFKAEPIPGTEGGQAPFFSPDRNWLGFYQDEEIRKISLSGGNPQTIIEAASIGAFWGDDDTIAFWKEIVAGIQLASSNGDMMEVVTSRDRNFLQGEVFHAWPQLLPSNNAVLFSAFGAGEGGRIALVKRDSGERISLIENALYARFVNSEHIVFARMGELLAAPFDLTDFVISGTSITVIDDIRTESASVMPVAHFDISDNGTLVYVVGIDSEEVGQIKIVSQTESVAVPIRGGYQGMRFSPNQSKVVMMSAPGDIWILDLERGDSRRLTDERGGDYWPLWSNDGSEIYFTSGRYGGLAVNIFRTSSDGSGEPERITSSAFHQQAQSLSPDGSVLAITQMNDQTTGFDILMVDLENDFRVTPFIQTDDLESLPSFSPDGKWIAYISDESGQIDVYMTSYPDPGAIIPLSIGGGTEPVWSDDGSVLYYRDLSGNRISKVTVSGDNPPRIGIPDLVMEGNFLGGMNWGRMYDIWPDGSKVIVVEQSQQFEQSTQINVVFNWFEELKRLVPNSD